MREVEKSLFSLASQFLSVALASCPVGRNSELLAAAEFLKSGWNNLNNTRIARMCKLFDKPNL